VRAEGIPESARACPVVALPRTGVFEGPPVQYAIGRVRYAPTHQLRRRSQPSWLQPCTAQWVPHGMGWHATQNVPHGLRHATPRGAGAGAAGECGEDRAG
jgi:hypothetical protein